MHHCHSHSPDLRSPGQLGSSGRMPDRPHRLDFPTWSCLTSLHILSQPASVFISLVCLIRLTDVACFTGGTGAGPSALLSRCSAVKAEQLIAKPIYLSLLISSLSLQVQSLASSQLSRYSGITPSFAETTLRQRCSGTSVALRISTHQARHRSDQGLQRTLLCISKCLRTAHSASHSRKT